MKPGNKSGFLTNNIVFSQDLTREIEAFACNREIDLQDLLLAICAVAVYRFDQNANLNIWVNQNETQTLRLYQFKSTIHFKDAVTSFTTPTTEDGPISASLLFSLVCQAAGAQLAGNTNTRLNLPGLTLIFDLQKTEEKIIGYLTYSPDALDPIKADSLASNLAAFAANLIHSPDQPIGQIPLLDESTHHLIIEQWGHGSPLEPASGCIHEKISFQAHRTPDKIAAVFGDKSIRYAELERSSNRLAAQLIQRQVIPGACVGIYMDRSLAMLVAMLAILKAGGMIVSFSLATPPKMFERILAETGITLLLKQVDFTVPVLQEKLQIIDLSENGLNLKAVTESSKTSLPKIDPHNGALLLYTSGSTGIPKGVWYSHIGFLNRAASQNAVAPLRADDIYAQWSPLSSIDAYDEVFAPLIYGCQTAIIPDEQVRSPQRFVEVLNNLKASRILLVPALLAEILKLEEPLHNSLPRMHTWFIGGERLSSKLAEKFSEHLPAATLYNYYGLTEGDGTLFDAGRPFHPAAIGVPIGRPAPGVRIYVLDEYLMPIPPGVPGEIHIASLGLAEGYYHQQILTEERFLNSRLADGAGAKLFKTGDIARFLPDGTIEYLGRKDYQIKIRGNTVNLTEVETLLLGHPAVSACVVAAKPDLVGNLHLAGYVVLREAISVQDLSGYLKERLPDYMVPPAIVILKDLPLNSNGKVNRMSLPEPTYQDFVHRDLFTEPRNPLEIKLVEIWEGILQIHPIGIHDNFFDLGGDSIRLIAMLNETERHFNKKIPMNIFFQVATIADLAELLRENKPEANWSCLVPIQPHGNNLPFFCVHAEGSVIFYHPLAQALGLDQPFYGLQARGLDVKSRPLSRVEDMAALYIQEMRTVQPYGPYQIGGYHLGGIIALEIARQLRAAGETVGLVALIDTYGPNYPVMSAATAQFKYRLAVHIKRLRARSFSGQLNYIKTVLGRRMLGISSFVIGRNPWALKLPLPHFIRFDMVRRSIDEAISRHKPEPYTGEVTLFRATRQPSGAIPNRSLGLQTLVSGEISVIDVPATHISIVEEPDVKNLAALLQTRLVNG